LDDEIDCEGGYYESTSQANARRTTWSILQRKIC
jgi:hypothetical protein